MTRNCLTLLCFAVLVAAAILTSTAQAAHPPYIILRSPAAPASHRPTYNYYPGYGFGVSTPTYAYGWFGVRRRSHGAQHSGYYQDYNQWSYH